MGAADFDGPFVPIVQYKMGNTYSIPAFSYFRLEYNLTPNLLAPLCGVALKIALDIFERIC